MAQYGIDFQPGAQQDQNGLGGGTPGASPLESVVRLLSLRLPTVVGARGLAPQQLLGGGPGVGGAALGGNPNSAQVLQWLQQLLAGNGTAAPSGGTFAPNGPPSSGNRTQIPSPIFRPGGGGDGSGPIVKTPPTTPPTGTPIGTPTVPPGSGQPGSVVTEPPPMSTPPWTPRPNLPDWKSIAGGMNF